MTSRAMRRRAGLVGACAIGALALAGCGDDAESAEEAEPFERCEIVSGSSETATATLRAELGDYVVVLDTPTVKAGAIKVDATNIGKRPHEVVIVKAADTKALPKDKDGSMAEEKLADLALIGEIEEFPPAVPCSGVFDLEPGSYVVLCNLVEKVGGATVAHYAKGMATTLTVTG